MFNQHYLDNFFTTNSYDPTSGRVRENNPYMDSEVDLDAFQQSDTVEVRRHGGRGARTQVKELSRLWSYRNGLDPDAANGALDEANDQPVLRAAIATQPEHGQGLPLRN
jgi:hypothetical protein